jgi:hypothetical protein
VVATGPRKQPVRDHAFEVSLVMIRRSQLCSGRALFARLFLLGGTVFFTACGDMSGDHPPLYSVKGQVLSKGKPLVGGVVSFEWNGPAKVGPDGAKDGPLRATAKILNDGKFAMNGYAGAEGMPAGKYKVSVTHVAPRSEKGILGGDIAPVSKANAVIVNRKYADFKTSDLETEVFADKPNEPIFDLK